MSFGGQSNAPWQRNVMQGHPQANTFHQGTQQMFMQNAQQNNMAAFGHGGGMQGGGGNMYPSGGGPSVSYPQPRSGLNPVAFQQGAGQSQSHYNSIGTVTKINNDCGLVNDEVFFYRNVCKGPEPKLGDRVIFEATYSNNGQFKWNATRIQLMQQHQQPQPLMGSSKSNYSSVAPPNEYQRSQMRHSSPKRSPVRAGISRHDRDRRDRERDRSRRSRDRDDVSCTLLNKDCQFYSTRFCFYRMNKIVNDAVKIVVAIESTRLIAVLRDEVVQRLPFLAGVNETANGANLERRNVI